MKTAATTVVLNLRETPGYLLRRCQQRSQEIFKEILGSFGMTQQQTALLIALARHTNGSIQNLADATAVDRNTLAGVTSRLIRRGLIVRRRSARDARAYELRISPAGTRLLKRMAPGIARVQQRILEPLEAGEREAFVDMARRIASVDAL